MRNSNQRRHARLRRRTRHVVCRTGDARSHWGKFGAAGVLIMCDGYVLLTQRSFSLENGKGKWSLPGGALDARWEQPIAGAMRELFEEVSGINVFELHRVAEDSVECSCGWDYTTFRLRADYVFDCYVHDWETRRIAWVPITMVENMNLLPSFRRYWNTHSRRIAAESPFVDHSDDFSEQRYDYDLDEHYSQSYYDKSGNSRFERPRYSYTSYRPNSTYKATGKYGTTYEGASAFTDARTGYQATGGGASGSTQAQFSDGYGFYPAGSYSGSNSTYGYDKYSGDNGFHYSGYDYSLPVDYDANWDDLEPSDKDFEQAEVDDQLVDLADMEEADWEEINDSVLDAIDRALASVGVD